MPASLDAIATRILDADRPAPAALVSTVTSWPASQRQSLTRQLLSEAQGRRWLRGRLLPALEGDDAAELAGLLLPFRDDFSAAHRDSTTAAVVQSLRLDDLAERAAFWAGSNAAAAFWQRVALNRPARIAEIARRVLAEAEPAARETTLLLLLLDPYSDVRLTGSERLELLLAALADPEEHVRGLAADALADDAPQHLASQLHTLILDPSERVRTAAWDAAFADDFESTRDAALNLLADASAPLDARRTALVALSSVLSTPEIAPVLEAVVVHPEGALAEVAADLLWSYHRSPSIALAAAESPHQSVREAARRLLHPETGSPAAGGSRPGAPNRSHEIYTEMLKGYERAKE